MKKIYVAASSRERERVAAIYGQIAVSTGLELTFNWLKQVELFDGTPEDQLDPRIRKMQAESDEQAIERADVMWLLAPNQGFTTKGAWFELGFARRAFLAKHSPIIIVSGPERFQTIFTECAHRFFTSDADALEWLRAA